MRRRTLRWVLALAGPAGVLVAAGAFVLWPRPDRVTRENFGLLRVGMSKPEVYAVIGPPGEYLTRDANYDDAAGTDFGEAPRFAHKEGVEVGKGDDAVLWVQFDASGHVSGATCIPLKAIDHGPIGNLLWRIRYQLFRLFPDK
jgi:hypothetical protein